MDLSARTEKRLDSNGNQCALIKVEAIPTCEFGGYIIGSVEKKLGAYWVYVCTQNPTTRKLIVSSEKFQPLEVEFSQFDITSIEPGATYTLRIEAIDQADKNVLNGQEYNENRLLKSKNDFALSPFYNLKGDRVLISKCLKKFRTILLCEGHYKRSFTIQKANGHHQEKYNSKNALYFRTPAVVMACFEFPMNLTRFERSQLKYSLIFELHDGLSITLEIYYIPDSQSYRSVFTNVDGEKFEGTFNDLQISTQDYLWETVYESDVFAKLVPGKSNHPYLFDLLDFWHTKYGE